MTEVKYKPDPVLEHALDVLFILNADHEQNCGANAMRRWNSAVGRNNLAYSRKPEERSPRVTKNKGVHCNIQKESRFIRSQIISVARGEVM
jgi:Citrate synthase, C-terminal domain